MIKEIEIHSGKTQNGYGLITSEMRLITLHRRSESCVENIQDNEWCAENGS